MALTAPNNKRLTGLVSHSGERETGSAEQGKGAGFETGLSHGPRWNVQGVAQCALRDGEKYEQDRGKNKKSASATLRCKKGGESLHLGRGHRAASEPPLPPKSKYRKLVIIFIT